MSTVLTYAQNGPHDSFYYDLPQDIVAGPPRNPEIKIDNPKIARRHITSFLLQTFFHRYMDEHDIPVGGSTSASSARSERPRILLRRRAIWTVVQAFELWVEQNVIASNGSLREQIRSWLPTSLRTAPMSLDVRSDKRLMNRFRELAFGHAET